MFHPSSSKDSKKSWKVKCNLLNVSDPPQDLIKEQYAFSRRNLSKYLTRSASCSESAGSCGTSPRSPASLLKRSMSAPSLVQIKSSCDDTLHPPQSQNPSAILTVVATVHPQRSQGHGDSFSMFHPSDPSSSKDLKKSWKVKCNPLNVSEPPQDLIKEQYAFNRRNLIKYLTRSASCNESAGSCGTSPRSPASLLKRSMSAPSLGQIKRSRDDTLH